MLASLATAIWVAAFGLFGNFWLTVYNRHQDRRGIAGALAGEIGAYIDLLEARAIARNFRTIIEIGREKRGKRLAAFPELPKGHPVFDKVADKIGLLPPEETRAISRIYNVVNGMRSLMGVVSTERFLAADDDYQAAMFNYLAGLLEQETTKAADLVRRLERTAGEGFWRYLVRGNKTIPWIASTYLFARARLGIAASWRP